MSSASALRRAAKENFDSEPSSWSAIVDPATFREGVPHDIFDEMREVGPVHWVEQPKGASMPPGPGFWAVVGHDEVGQVLRAARVFSSAAGLTQLYDAPPHLLRHYRSMMINMDPPEHTRLRRLLMKSFTPAAVESIDQQVQHRSRELLDAAVGGRHIGTVDFARDVVTELPLMTLADMLGMPDTDRWLMFDWANRVIGFQDTEYSTSRLFNPDAASPMAKAAMALRPEPGPDGKMPDARTPEGMADLYEYARLLADHLRVRPGGDIMSILLTNDSTVSADEFQNLFWLFCVAGNETVRNALPGGMQGLLTHPTQRRLLWKEPARLNTAVEEMLRWWSAVVHFRRTAVEDVYLGGQHIAAGEKVVVFLSAANRDPAVFDHPHEFDITRDPNPHLAFGTGPHFCIGATLARVQMRAMVQAVMDQWTDVEPDGPPTRLQANFQNGIKHQPVKFTCR